LSLESLFSTVLLAETIPSDNAYFYNQVEALSLGHERTNIGKPEHVVATRPHAGGDAKLRNNKHPNEK
jgi:hypothetical protein